MIHVKKAKNKNLLTAIVCASIFAVLLIAYIIFRVIVNALPEDKPSTERPEIMPGESYYLNKPIALPEIKERDIQFLTVRSHKGSFSMSRPDEDGSFIFYYKDAAGNDQVYFPGICVEENNFDYQNLYAVEKNDGFGRIYKLTYLCSALGSLYFDERIVLSDDTTLKAEQLAKYGFDGNNAESISFIFLDSEGKKQTQVIRIGDKLVNGAGYYFMVEGRNYVYSSTDTRLDYALGGFESFIHSTIVAAGLEIDSMYEPYLTTDYKQWTNTMYENEGDIVVEGSQVIASGKEIIPIDKGADFLLPDGAPRDGYEYGKDQQFIFDLDSLKGDEVYTRLINTLKGKAVGDYASNKFYATVISGLKNIDLDKNKYKYEIYEIESVLTDDGEIFTDGVSVADYSTVKVVYDYYVHNGTSYVRQSNYPCHAVIDLDGEFVPDDLVAALKASKVGELDTPIVSEIEYSENAGNTVVRQVRLLITDIVAIYDEDGNPTNTVTETSYVSYKYSLELDGVKGAEQSATVKISDLTEDDGPLVKEKLLGKSVGANLNLEVKKYNVYCEIMYEFITYEIAKIDYFVTRELVSSFRFINASERDPFYGESLYENTMDNEYRLYALNAGTCEAVVEALGGIVNNQSSTSAGLVGEQTVAVGLTPDVMKKYGLYANTVYFELPRGIIIKSAVDSDGDKQYDADEIDDYDWLDTLGFALYISDEQIDGTRYVGSELYDIVVKIDGSHFKFIDHTFVDFWARRSLVIVDIQNLEKVSVDFSMTDVYGSYDFELGHQPIFIDGNGNHYLKKPANVATSPYDFITVSVSQNGNAMETEYSKYLAAKGYDKVSLSQLYNDLRGNGEVLKMGNDTLGTGYFKEFIQSLYSTSYTGVLTKDEQTEAFASAPKILSLKFKLDSSAFLYVYDFYRLDDRKIMVAIYRADEEGNKKSEVVSDFYVSTFTFKKLSAQIVSILDAKEVNSDSSNTDIIK